MAPSATPAVKRYHLTGWRRWLICWVFGSFALLGVALAFAEPGAGLLIAAFMLVMMLIFDWIIRRTRLEFAPTGVTLRQFGYSLHADWNNVVGLRADKGREGFILAQPMDGKGARRLAIASGYAMRGVPMYDNNQRMLLEEYRFIPIEAFGPHLHKGTMVADVAAYAPQLAIEMGETLANPPLEAVQTPAQKRKQRWLFVGIGLLTAGSLLMAFLAPKFMTVLYSALLALVVPFMALSSAWSVWNAIRRRAWFMAAMLFLLTIMLGAFALLSFSRLAAVL